MKKNNITLSYAIPVCNEHKELKFILHQINSFIGEDDEIVIQCDQGNVTDEVIEVITEFSPNCRSEFKVIDFALNKDFAAFKNNLKDNCSKDYIFQIDADEYLGDSLLMTLPIVLQNASDVELFWLPRINIVYGLTDEYVESQRWRVNEFKFPVAITTQQPVINFPDYQARLFKNIPAIKWEGRVHEKVVGAKKFAYIGKEFIDINILSGEIDSGDLEALQSWCLIHEKDFVRQQKQNEFYETL